MEKAIIEKAEKWLTDEYDDDTKEKVRFLIENDENELIESFYKDLEFGTGGLRGIMGVGTNRMNKYTVGAATQGLANYINEKFSHIDKISVAIAYDCRNNSRKFAEIAANIFSSNNMIVYLFEDLRPTPELSFAIRHFQCQSGIVITASHNPKEYNGFKAYWNDGGQVVPPHDKNIIKEVQKIVDIKEIKFEGKKENIIEIGDDFDKLYIEKLKSLSLSPDIIKKQKDLKIVYTPIHGTGVKLVPDALRKYGFTYIYSVPEQDITDGNFPTVVSPNPENAEALELALNKAKAVDAELVLATDPDADRVGIAVKDLSGKYILLNGNQIASLLIYYIIRKKEENGVLAKNNYIVKTIVTSELLFAIADKYKVEKYDTLTGFKYIAELIKKYEGDKLFIGGGEESYGYLFGEFVRDKDAVMSSALIAETAAWAKDCGKTLYELLIDIYVEFGFYKEALVNIVKKGKSGEEEIEKIMSDFRNNPPSKIAGSKVIEIRDYDLQQCENFVTETIEPANLPKSNVIQFITENGSKITVRPSGTEPKIKFYIGVNDKLENKDDFDKVNSMLEDKIDLIEDDFVPK